MKPGYLIMIALGAKSARLRFMGGQMHRLRTIAILCASLILLSIGSFAQAQGPGSKTQAAASPSQVQVDLLRGLADIFSRGMDTLTAKLNQQGYSARVYSTNAWQSVAHRIANGYSRGHKDIIVIIGHSLGANATFDVANQLDRQNIPIELIVTFDATRPQPVPKNVLHLVNFYQENGFGKPVSAGPDFKGELSNIDLTADTGLSHTTIEKSPRLHLMVMQKIEEVVKKDLESKVKAAKPKTKRQKSGPS
jgi:Thioesterase domain